VTKDRSQAGLHMTIEAIVEAKTPEQPKLSFDGDSLFYLEEKDGCLQVFHRDLFGGNPIQADTVDLDISDLFVSPFSNRISIMLSRGTEKHRVQYCDFDGARFTEWVIVDNANKERFGSWQPNGIHYIQRVPDTDDLWSLHFHDFSSRKNTEIRQVGYNAKMLGYVDDKPITFSEHAKFDCELNWSGEVKQEGEKFRVKEYGSTTPDGGVITIRGEYNSHFSEVVKFHSKDGVIQTTTIYTASQIASIIPYNDSEIAPRGELLDIVVDDGDVVLNFNIDGACSLFHGNFNHQHLGKLELNSIQEKIGPFWIDSMHLKKGKLVMETSSFWAPKHIWLLDLNSDGGLIQLTDPPDSPFGIGTVEPKIHVSTGQQYLLIEPDSDFRGTVIFFHGGPTVPMRGKWDYVIASFLFSGFRVITPNPRGSLGRGPKFAGLDDGPLRLDLIDNEVAPFLESMKQEFGDLFMYGGSYGGWLVLKIATSPCGSLVRAGATRNGIGDFTKFFEKTAKFRWKHRHIEYIGPLETSEDVRERILDELSPTKSKSVFCRNIYLFSGEDDTRVPWETSEQFKEDFQSSETSIQHHVFRNENDNGKQINWVEGHKIKRKQNKISLMRKTIDFFENLL
jgi:hypothetical protein